MLETINAYDVRVLREIARRYGGERGERKGFFANMGTRQNTAEQDCKLFTSTLYKVCARIEEIAAHYPDGVPTPPNSSPKSEVF